jgi:hypothetical protein
MQKPTIAPIHNLLHHSLIYFRALFAVPALTLGTCVYMYVCVYVCACSCAHPLYALSNTYFCVAFGIPALTHGTCVYMYVCMYIIYACTRYVQSHTCIYIHMHIPCLNALRAFLASSASAFHLTASCAAYARCLSSTSCAMGQNTYTYIYA